MTYLDFNELLDPVDNIKVLESLVGLAYKYFVSSPQPPPVLVVDKGLGVGLFVIQVAQHDGGRLDQQLAALVVARELVAFRVHDFGFEAGDQGA